MAFQKPHLSGKNYKVIKNYFSAKYFLIGESHLKYSCSQKHLLSSLFISALNKSKLRCGKSLWWNAFSEICVLLKFHPRSVSDLPKLNETCKVFEFHPSLLLIPLFFPSQKKKGFICVPGRHPKDEAPPYPRFNFFEKIQLPGCPGITGWTVQRTLRCVPSPPAVGSICAGNNLLGCDLKCEFHAVSVKHRHCSYADPPSEAGSAYAHHRCWGVSRASARWCPALHSPDPVSLSSALSQQRHFWLQ